MKENIDINEIAHLAKLSLNNDEALKAREEMLAFTEYVKILDEYCGKDLSQAPTVTPQALREDKPCIADTRVFQGYVIVPLTVGGEE